MPAATTASARSCCTAATCAAASVEVVTAIASANPSGRASVDQERKRGLRTSRAPRPGVNAAIVYGPVPGGGRAADELRRRARGEHVGERHGELVQELGIGPPEVDGDRPRRGVGLDALARGRSAAGCTLRRRRCRCRRRDLAGEAHDALDRGAEVLRPYRRAVGEAQAGAQLEGVGAPAVGRLRDARGEVGDERAAAGARDAAVGDEAVIGERQHRPGVVVVARGIEALADRTARTRSAASRRGGWRATRSPPPTPSRRRRRARTARFRARCGDSPCASAGRCGSRRPCRRRPPRSRRVRRRPRPGCRRRAPCRSPRRSPRRSASRSRRRGWRPRRRRSRPRSRPARCRPRSTSGPRPSGGSSLVTTPSSSPATHTAPAPAAMAAGPPGTSIRRIRPPCARSRRST